MSPDRVADALGKDTKSLQANFPHSKKLYEENGNYSLKNSLIQSKVSKKLAITQNHLRTVKTKIVAQNCQDKPQVNKKKGEKL